MCMKASKHTLNIIAPQESDKNPLTVLLVLLVMTSEVHRCSRTAEVSRDTARACHLNDNL